MATFSLLLPVCGHPQLWLISLWDCSALAAPWRWDWEVIYFETILISLMRSHTPTDKHQDVYTKAVCPESKMPKFMWSVQVPSKDRTLSFESSSCLLVWERCADFHICLSVPFHAWWWLVSPLYPTSMSHQDLLTLLCLWPGCPEKLRENDRILSQPPFC